MSITKTKRYLVVLAAIGLVSVAIGGAGTFASFNAEVTNAGNTFQTGSITLSNKVNSGSLCYSSTGANNINSTGCDAIFSSVNWLPGDVPTSEHLTLSNTGSLAASTLTLWAPLVSNAGVPTDPGGFVCGHQHYTPGTDTNAFVGSGNTCTGLQLQIQEYTDGTFTTATTTCAFPAGASACGSTYAPLSTLPSPSAKLTIPGGIGSAATRYFALKVSYPASGTNAADNAYQAQQTFFNLTWHIDQA